MKDWVQICGISGIILLLLLSAAAILAILDNPSKEEFRKQIIIWFLCLALIISDAIW